MVDRLRCGFLLVAPAPGWSVDSSVHGALRLRSPRTVGTLHLATIRMPEDVGSMDFAKLWARAKDRPWTPRHLRRFDESEWQDGEVAGIAYSTLWDLQNEEHRSELPLGLWPHHPEF